MKLIVLMYLEEDSGNVEKLLAAHEVMAYSELPVEGHGIGTAGWNGKVPAFRSRMLIAFLPATKAQDLLVAVDTCTGCTDPKRPIHAWQMDVENAVTSGQPFTTKEA